MNKIVLSVFSALLLLSCGGGKDVTTVEGTRSSNNHNYWQQHVDYKIEIDMDVDTYQYTGKQSLIYTNNSPDVLHKVFYHLYFNAFQPGSEMDVFSRTIEDPDQRVLDRIYNLAPDEIGYMIVNSLKQNGIPVRHDVVGTVLEVDLNAPIQPGEKVRFDMQFEAQTPLTVRRAGRDNGEGVALSMAQWYPKIAEFDFEGWHADPYLGREFYGVWGNFDVTIKIDKNYILGGSGYLQNPNEIGHGYETSTVSRPDGDKLAWHFIAPNVHDFTWAGDPDYIHDTVKVPDGPDLHFFYKKDSRIIDNWKNLQPKAVQLLNYFNTHLGKYPYKQYSFIQGGDGGGMEYAMCTLMAGTRDFMSLVGLASHELAHSWFQFLLASNELKHEWMDEGFVSYISAHAMNEIKGLNSTNPAKSAYKGYFSMVNTGKEQPQTTHADRYEINQTYWSTAYSKGSVFLSQLGYVIGKENLNKTLKKYYSDWAFKHPTPNDFIRCAEKVSGLELDWYLTDWTRTTNTIDYGIKDLKGYENGSLITLERIGLMPMPIDLEIEYIDGTKELFYIPLRMMRGEKPASGQRTQLEDWAWAYSSYEFNIEQPPSEIKAVRIDPNEWMADIDRNNNNR